MITDLKTKKGRPIYGFTRLQADVLHPWWNNLIPQELLAAYS